MLTQIPDMTIAGRIPLDVPLGALLVVGLLAALALGLLTELGLGTTLRPLAHRAPSASRAPRGRVVTAVPRG